MSHRTRTHLGQHASGRRHRGLFVLAAMAGVLGLLGANAAVAAASGPSSTSQTVRAGAKAIGRTSKPSGSGLVSLHSSQPTGAVTPTPAVYLVFWGSQWSNDPAQAATALQGLFGNLYGA